MPVLSVLNGALAPVYTRLEEWVKRISVNVTDETDWNDSTKGSW